MSKQPKGAVAPSSMPVSTRLLQVQNVEDLKGLTTDNLRSIAVYASENARTLAATFPEIAVYQTVNTTFAALPNDIESMSKAELLDLLLQVYDLLKLADNALAITGVVALNQSNLGSELNNIDFFKLISGPLNAVVQAQAASAMSTIALIKEIGFEVDENGKPTAIRKVEFMYEKTGKNEDGSDSVESTQISVPILAMINVPSLRIQDVDIQFNAKINGVEEVKTSTAIGANAEGGFGIGPFSLKVSASFQRSTTSGAKVEREYTMAVKVKATQDEMPPGLEKVLNLLSA